MKIVNIALICLISACSSLGEISTKDQDHYRLKVKNQALAFSEKFLGKTYFSPRTLPQFKFGEKLALKHITIGNQQCSRTTKSGMKAFCAGYIHAYFKGDKMTSIPHEFFIKDSDEEPNIDENFFESLILKTFTTTDPFAEYKNKLWFQKYKSEITNRTVRIGMPEEALYLSLGEPSRVNETVTSGTTFKQLVYSNGVYIYIRNGKVNSFQNSR